MVDIIVIIIVSRPLIPKGCIEATHMREVGKDTRKVENILEVVKAKKEIVLKSNSNKQ